MSKFASVRKQLFIVLQLFSLILKMNIIIDYHKQEANLRKWCEDKENK